MVCWSNKSPFKILKTLRLFCFAINLKTVALETLNIFSGSLFKVNQFDTIKLGDGVFSF